MDKITSKLGGGSSGQSKNASGQNEDYLDKGSSATVALLHAVFILTQKKKVSTLSRRSTAAPGVRTPRRTAPQTRRLYVHQNNHLRH